MLLQSKVVVVSDEEKVDYPLLVFIRKRKESFACVECRKRAAASPTKRIEQNRIFKFELTKQLNGMIP